MTGVEWIDIADPTSTIAVTNSAITSGNTDGSTSSDNLNAAAVASSNIASDIYLISNINSIPLTARSGRSHTDGGYMSSDKDYYRHHHGDGRIADNLDGDGGASGRSGGTDSARLSSARSVDCMSHRSNRSARAKPTSVRLSRQAVKFALAAEESETTLAGGEGHTGSAGGSKLGREFSLGRERSLSRHTSKLFIENKHDADESNNTTAAPARTSLNNRGSNRVSPHAKKLSFINFEDGDNHNNDNDSSNNDNGNNLRDSMRSRKSSFRRRSDSRISINGSGVVGGGGGYNDAGRQIVLDVGSFQTRAGFADEQTPSSVFRTMVSCTDESMEVSSDWD